MASTRTLFEICYLVGDQLKTCLYSFSIWGVFFFLIMLGGPAQIQAVDSKIVVDKKTGLTWTRGEPGKMSWTEAMEYCETLRESGYQNWRLPDIDDLESSYKLKGRFPDFAESGEYYWSSTVNTDSSDYAHGIYADGGYAFGNGHKESKYYVRCVRNRRKASCIKGDCKNGYGVFIFSNGDKYDGAWNKGKRHGWGVYTWNSGRQFKGEFRNNKRVK
jgi:Protein of unknown function (DUF1566)/MORN repeat